MGYVGFISDLHVPNKRLPRIAQLLSSVSLDGLVLAGDFVDFADERSINKLIKFLDRYGPSRIIAVLGNHEHYLSRNMLRKGLDSLKARERVISKLKDSGIPVLDESDTVATVGNMYIAGCVGWYDYKFAPPGYSLEDFKNCNPFKVSLRELELCDLHRKRFYCPPWWRRDCLYIRLPFSHEIYVNKCVEKVKGQLKNSGHPRIVVYHHVPRRDLIKYTGSDEDFDFAYAGSPKLNEPIVVFSVELVVYGHIHNRSRKRILVREGITYGNAYLWYRERPGLLIAEARHGRLKTWIAEP